MFLGRPVCHVSCPITDNPQHHVDAEFVIRNAPPRSHERRIDAEFLVQPAPQRTSGRFAVLDVPTDEVPGTRVTQTSNEGFLVDGLSGYTNVTCGGAIRAITGSHRWRNASMNSAAGPVK